MTESIGPFVWLGTGNEAFCFMVELPQSGGTHAVAQHKGLRSKGIERLVPISLPRYRK